MSRTVLAVVVLASWIASLGWLVGREYGGPARTPGRGAPRLVPPSASFFLAELDGRAVGMASVTVDTVPLGLRLAHRLRLDGGSASSPRPLALATDLTLGYGFELREFEAAAAERGGRHEVRGAVDGDTLALLGGGRQWGRERLPGGRVVLPASLPLQITFPERLWQGGRVVRLDVFDPVAVEWRRAEISRRRDSLFLIPDSAVFEPPGGWRVAHVDSVRATELLLRLAGVPYTLWVDREGRVVEASTPFGLAFRRSAFELVNARPRPAGAAGHDPELLTDVPAPPAERALEELRVIVAGPPDAAAAAASLGLSAGRQRLADDTLIVRRQEAEAGGPSLADLGGALRADSLRGLLGPAPLLPVDDPLVRSAARRLVRPDRSARESVRRVVEWVGRSVAPAGGSNLPDPAAALRRGRGSAEERALLVVAIARAGGMPARTVGGAVWRDGGFHYHGWVEVYVGEWLALDPASDRYPADASYIRLVTGGLGRPAELFPIFGGLRLRVVAAQGTS